MNTPTDAECNDQAVAFDILQVQVKALDQLLHNMADIDDMMDELDDAAKKAGDDYHAKAHRQARAYKLTQIVLTATMQQYQLVEEQMTNLLGVCPRSREAAGALAGRGRQSLTIPHGPTQPRSKAGAFSVCEA